jgi:outer membrane receptor protein involved in Fe transport
MRHPEPRLAVALALSFASPAVAEEIVVTASRLPPMTGEASYAVTNLDTERLATSVSDRVDDALRREAGFQMFRRTSSAAINASTQGVTLRGLGGNASSRALVTMDGVPLADPFGGWIPWSALSLSDIGSVRIMRGGGAVAAGEGALSGSIELNSAVPPPGYSARGEFSYGSDNRVEANERLSWRGGRWAVSIAGLVRHSDGYKLIAPDQAGPADLPAASRSRALNGRLSYALDAVTKIEASALIYDEAKSNGFAISNNSDRGTDFALRFIHQPAHGWSVEAIGWHKTRNFSSGFASADNARTVVTLNSVQDAVPAHGSGGRLELRPTLPDGLALRLGGEVRWAEGETQERFQPVAGAFNKSRVAGGQQLIAGGFLEATATPRPALTLTAGGRFDTWTIKHGQRIERVLAANAVSLNAAYPDRSGQEWTGRVGGQFKPSRVVMVRAAAYTGWRLPTLNELFRPFRVGTINTESNAALNPEHLRGADAGLVVTPAKNWRIELTGFANYLDDAIVNATLSATAGGAVNQQRQNVPHARSLGFEVAAHGVLPLGFVVDGSLIYADARVRIPGVLAGKALAETPSWQASATLAWAGLSDQLHAAVTLRQTSAAYDDDLNSRQLPGVTTIDAALHLQILPRVTLSFHAENLTDARIVTALSTAGVQSTGTPRQLSGELGFSF